MITLFIYIYYIISRYGWTCYVQFSCDYTTREKKTTTKKARENVETTWNSTSGYDMPHQRHWQLWRAGVRGSAVWLTVCHPQPCCLEGRLFTAVRPYPEKDRKRLETPKKTRKRLYFQPNFILYKTIYHLILLYMPKYVSGVFWWQNTWNKP